MNEFLFILKILYAKLIFIYFIYVIKINIISNVIKCYELF